MKNSTLFALLFTAFSTVASAQITITAQPFDPCDQTDNDPDGNSPAVRARHAAMWNSPNFWDPKCESHDLAEGPKKLAVAVASTCPTAVFSASFVLSLDLTGDGTPETTVSSASPTLRFGIADSTAGGARFFQVTRDPEWDAAFPTAADRFFSTVDLPYGSHKIVWTVSDGCGATTSKTILFEVKDCKKPTITCKPLAGPIMNGASAMVTIWATDFVEYAEDNACFVYGWYSIRKAGDAGFGSGQPPLGLNGAPITYVTFNCSDSTITAVEIWTRDAAGNYGFCQTYVHLNKANCTSQPPAPTVIELRTAYIFGNQCIQNAAITLSGGMSGIPSPMIPSNGCGVELMVGLPLVGNFFLTPSKNINPTNGVSVYDIVLITKHIVGSQPFDSPYKWIAADVNRSGSVSTSDVVAARKLVLGLIPNFPNNSSWRFVRHAYTFVSSNPAGEVFPETISYADAVSMADNDFVGIKICDLNGSASVVNFDGQAAEDRSPDQPFSLAVADRFLQKGELFEARFELKNEGEKAVAAQFALEFEGLEITEILGEKGLKPDLFGLFQQEKLLTSAWIEADGPPVFSLKMRAEKAGRLSEMLRLSDQKTRSEGYSSDGQPRLLRLDFETEKSEKGQLELFENRPNPFLDATEIRFFSPENEAVELSVFDAAGRLVFTKNVAAETGLNSVELTRNEVAASGFLLLKIRSKSGAAARWLN